MLVATSAHNLAEFGLNDMAACGKALRNFGQQAPNMEAFARRATLHLYENLLDENGRKASALVRFFVTRPAEHLPRDLKKLVPAEIPDSTRCLTLLGTAGAKPEWRRRSLSGGHKVIPLVSKGAVECMPMIAQLIRQFGLNIEGVLQPDESVLIDAEQQSYNVFYVADAKDNPSVPAQAEFVIPMGIKSVLGFGGMLPSGDLFAMIIFATVAVPRNTADLFRTVALSLRLGILRFGQQAVFAPELDS